MDNDLLLEINQPIKNDEIKILEHYWIEYMVFKSEDFQIRHICSVLLIIFVYKSLIYCCLIIHEKLFAIFFSSVFVRW